MGQPPPPPAQPPLPCTPRLQPQRAGAGGGGLGTRRAGERRLARTSSRHRLTTPLCRARLGSPASACSPRFPSVPVSLRIRLGALRDGGRPGRRAGRTERSGSQCPSGGRAEPGSGSRPSGSSSGGGDGGGGSIPRVRCPHSELLLLAGMSVIIVSGVAGPLH